MYARDIAPGVDIDDESEDEIEEERRASAIEFENVVPGEECSENNYHCRGEGLSDVLQGLDTPGNIFSYFMPESMFARICRNTNKYGQEKYNDWSLISVSQLKKYIGITILVGVLGLKNIQYAWGHQSTRGISIPIVESCMSLHLFQRISSALHFVDNDMIADDDAPLRKIAWFIDEVKRSFQAAYTPKRVLSLDEMTTPYKGHWRLKQFIANKPHKWCIKMFALVEYDTWYVCNFEIYTGATHPYVELPYKNVFGNPPLSMHKACVDLIKPFAGKGRVIVSDRFYTSVGMCKCLFASCAPGYV